MTDRRTWLGLAAAVALLVVFAGYYVVHKPLTPDQAVAYTGTLANGAVAALLTGLGGALGRRLLLSLMGPGISETLGVRVALAVALGWGALALGVLALGLLRLLYAPVLWGGALLLLFWLRRDLLAWAADLAATLRSLMPTGRLDRLCAGYVLLVLALGLLQSAAPPLKWDALVYHLTLPKLYAQAHDVYLPAADFSVFTGMPQLGEMLYAAATLLRVDLAAGALAAQMLGWAGGALLAVGLATAAHAHDLPAWLAPAVLFSSFSVASALAWAYVDLLLMLLALTMLLALAAWRRTRATAWLALAGIFGGLAFSCKYTGFMVPFGGLAVVAHTLWACPEPGRPLRQRLLPVGGFLFVAGLVALPWLLKNWAFTGSPVYPLLLPTADMDAARQWFYSRPDLAERSLLGAVFIYWRAAFLGVQGGNGLDVTLGPLLIVLPAALLLGWRQLPASRRAAMLPWGLFVAAAYLAWVLLLFQSSLGTQLRLFFAALPPLALLGAAGWSALRLLDTTSLRVSQVVTAGVLLALGLNTLELANHFVAQQPLAYLAGHQTRPAYEFEQLGLYPVVMERLNALPAGARVTFLWEARSLGCAAHLQCVPDVVIDRWWHLRRTSVSAAAILQRWQAEAATHVLVYETGLTFARAEASSPFTPDDWAELDNLRGALTPLDTIGEGYSLYAVPAP